VLIENLNYIFEKQQETQDSDESYEYIQLSLLDLILEIYKSDQKSSENEFNVELLIQILKLSQNIRVQQKVLLLLSELSSSYPDKILENVLVMFVFVGNKLIRKDDEYSLNIITKTINTIIPEILKAKTVSLQTSTGHNINPRVCKILQSFVITLPYIPNHRKTLIFNELLNLIGTDTYLWVIILQLFDYYFIESKKSDEKNDT
jgi:U3 small nucleolar RNA-associated protein 10